MGAERAAVIVGLAQVLQIKRDQVFIQRVTELTRRDARHVFLRARAVHPEKMLISPPGTGEAPPTGRGQALPSRRGEAFLHSSRKRDAPAPTGSKSFRAREHFPSFSGGIVPAAGRSGLSQASRALLQTMSSTQGVAVGFRVVVSSEQRELTANSLRVAGQNGDLSRRIASMSPSGTGPCTSELFHTTIARSRKTASPLPSHWDTVK